MKDLEDRREDTRRLVQTIRDDLSRITQDARESSDYELAGERLSRWKERAVDLIAKHISPNEARKLNRKRKVSFIMNDPLRNLVDKAKMYDSFLEALDEGLTLYPRQIFDAPHPTEEEAVQAGVPEVEQPSLVFLIHGHDELNLLRLKELLRDRWSLECLVMSGEPGKGRTLIEKFEEEAQRAAFAIALLTPDDIVDIGDDQYSQARPNVIFELGWFYGRLGRDRVCILFKEGTTIHSDLNGISRIQFSESVSEKLDEIEGEFIAAGILAH